jgi:hypothetical protein
VTADDRRPGVARNRRLALPLSGLTVIDARDGSTYDLGRLTGVNVVVLIRHRH